MGGYQQGKEIFAQRGKFKLALPLCCIKVDARRGLLKQLKRLTLQYVIIRPSMAVLAIVLHSLRTYCPGNYSPYHGYIYVTAINFISVTVAMYALVQFYTVSKKDIKQFKPMSKMLSVKFVIFLSFWQQVLVSLFVTIHGIQATTYWSTDNIATGVQDALMCFEMLLAAIWHIWAFEYDQYDTGKKTNILSAMADTFNPYDIAADVYHSFFPEKLRNRTKKHSGAREISFDTSLSMETTSITAYEEGGDVENDEHQEKAEGEREEFSAKSFISSEL